MKRRTTRTSLAALIGLATLAVASMGMTVAQDSPAKRRPPQLSDLFDKALLAALLDTSGPPSRPPRPDPADEGENDGETEDGEEEKLPESSLAIVFTNRGHSLDQAERAKFYIHKPGESDDFVAWGHATRTAVFPGGTYDVAIRYENDAIEREVRHKDVELVGDFVHPFAFDVTEASLTVEVTNGSRAIEPYAGSYTVRRRGRRGGALTRKRPGERVTVEPGYYDVEIRYRDSAGLKTTVLENRHVDGDLFESVEIGIPLAHITVTLTADGERLPPETGRWRVFEPGQRSAWLAERRSGELLGIEAGTYDIGAFVERDGRMTERWLVQVDLTGERHERIEMGVPRSALQVDVTRDGQLLQDAWFTVYPAGNREAAIVSAPSGGQVELERGTYDIGGFLRVGGIRADRWIENHLVTSAEELGLEIDARPAFLRVLPRGTGGGRRPSQRGRLLVVLDSSASTRARTGNRTRMEILRPALEEVFRDISTARLDVGLRVYGAALDGERDCNDSQLLVSPTDYDRAALTTSLDRLQPNGRSPLAYSLEQTEFDFSADQVGSVVVVTSGVDGCGGDPCRVAARLAREGKVERISVIGFGVDRDRMRSLDCIGQYYFANTAGEFKSALRDIMRNARRNDEGRIVIFDAADDSWVADGFLGDKIQLSEGRYDVVIHTRGGKTYEWTDLRISGNIEAVASRRPPVNR